MNRFIDIADQSPHVDTATDEAVEAARIERLEDGVRRGRLTKATVYERRDPRNPGETVAYVITTAQVRRRRRVAREEEVLIVLGGGEIVDSYLDQTCYVKQGSAVLTEKEAGKEPLEIGGLRVFEGEVRGVVPDEFRTEETSGRPKQSKYAVRKRERAREDREQNRASSRNRLYAVPDLEPEENPKVERPAPKGERNPKPRSRNSERRALEREAKNMPPQVVTFNRESNPRKPEERQLVAHVSLLERPATLVLAGQHEIQRKEDTPCWVIKLMSHGNGEEKRDIYLVTDNPKERRGGKQFKKRPRGRRAEH